MVSLFYVQKNFYLYLPESFEWLILKSGVIKGNDIIEMTEQPYNYVESSKYASWEQFFCALLIEKTKDTYLAYTKNELNPVYLRDSIVVDILKQIKENNEVLYEQTI